ncbi:MAG TPA: hydroxymethylbilane synthase [Burkholderiaceae bacterium]|nr:hydroxymethylbilane synthase [Burkholderiaceae bacterium]
MTSSSAAPVVPPSRLVIATRESRLALWQAHHVRDRLRALYPQCEVELLGMTTRGDQILDRSLSKVGGKGLFVKELEVALLEGRADLAVHSLKDVPMRLEPEFALTTVLEREDPRDAFVSNHHASLDALPAGAVVGTSSLRRAASLRARHPHLRIAPLRGNLDTRLAKLDRGDFDAIVLAGAGLKRLGLAQRIRSWIEPDVSLPAAGQGALGIEILAARSDVAAVLHALHHPTTASCVLAERAVARALDGNCATPIAAYCVPHEQGGRLHLRAMVASEDGQERLEAEGFDDVERCEALGREVAEVLLARGAARLLKPAH